MPAKEGKHTREVIGWQVVDATDNVPPGMFSYAVYSLAHCLEVQRTEPSRWRLLPIYEGTIEEPFFMFEEGA